MEEGKNVLKDLKNTLIELRKQEEKIIDTTNEDRSPCIYNHHLGRYAAYGKVIYLINEILSDENKSE